MALSYTSSDNDENVDDNLLDDNNGDSEGEDDVDEDILEALEDAIAEDATDAEEESIYDTDDGSGDEDDGESELVVALSSHPLGPSLKIDPPSNDYSLLTTSTPNYESKFSPAEVIPSPHLYRSPTPGVPPPRTRSPSPAFLRKTKLLANIFSPKSYTVEACCALPHPVPTHSLASSLCMTHVITGSEDGYIRDYDIFTGLNGKNYLTAPQRHHCGVVEGLLKYAPLKCWWENPIEPKHEDSSEESLSPVYSLLMHSDALWTLAGTHLGHINLFTVRHDPGRLCHILPGHRGPVSAMSMQHDEQGFFSAGWDGTAIHWDLNTGQITRNFVAHGSQLTAIAVRPLVPVSQIQPPSIFTGNMDETRPRSPSPVEMKPNIQQDLTGGSAGHQQDMDAKSDGSYDPLFDEPDADAPPPTSNTQQIQEPSQTPIERVAPAADLSLPGTVPHSQFTPRAVSIAKGAPPVLDPATYASYSADVLMTASVDGQVVLWDLRAHTLGKGAGRLHMTDKTPPWCASACWSADGTQIYAGRRNGTIDVWDVRQFGSRSTPRIMKILRNPQSSGVVSCIAAFPDSRHLISASIDNIRLWNVADAGESDGRKNRSGAQFKIIPGHHGGFISQMLVDPAARFLVTASGNRGWHGESTRTVFVHEIKAII